MSRLVWGQGTKNYETGLDRGVFYPSNGDSGVAWNGLAEVTESYPDTESRKRHLDGQTIAQRRRPGEFSGSIRAFGYPDEFFEDILVARRPRTFGFSYRTMTRGQYNVHLVYNVLLGETYLTNKQIEPESYSWEFTTIPVSIPGFAPSSHLVIQGDNAYSPAIADLEDLLYGTDEVGAHLPSPVDILEIFEENALLRIIDHGDGTWTAIGPDEAITMISPTEFEITWPSAVYIDSESYTLSSL